jgi:hypothetical protein
MLEPVITERGSITGMLDTNDIPLEMTLFGVQLKYYVAPGNTEISMGFRELDENGSFHYENLNTGSYKIGLFFYGEFNGEIWYDAVSNEGEAQLITITPQNPTLTGIDFTFTHPSLANPYVVVDEVMLDTGFDNQIDFGETVSFSLRLRNIGEQPVYNNEIRINNYFTQISMDQVNETIVSLAPNGEIIVGPYEFSVAPDIPDSFQFSLFYSFYSDLNVNNAEIPFIAYAPDVEIQEYVLNNNEGMVIENSTNTVSIQFTNNGHADLQYPILSISSTDPEVILTGNYETGYYVIPADWGILDFSFDFNVDNSGYHDGQLDFTVQVYNLAGNYEEFIDLVIPYSPATSNQDNVVESRNITLGNYPNPFNPETTISFNLENPDNAIIEIYNSRGQIIKQFEQHDFRQDTKGYSVIWNGRDERQNSVASGIYFYKLSQGTYTHTRKMVLLK